MAFIVEARVVIDSFNQFRMKALRMANVQETLDEKLARVTLHGDSETGCYPVVVYIDEAHEIGALDGFDSAFADLREQEVVGIYLSTTSSINELARPTMMIDSDRNPPGTTHVLRFTELYLDTFSHLHFTGAAANLTLQKVRSICVAASLGRSLYVFMFYKGKLDLTLHHRWSAQLATKEQYPIQLLLDLAAHKLTGTFKDSSMNASGRNALLCCRLLIHHTQNQAGQDLSKTLVASHFGTAFIPQSRSTDLARRLSSRILRQCCCCPENASRLQ